MARSVDTGPDPDVYRPMSGLAVAAPLLGLSSALTLAYPLASFIPLLGLAISAMALRDIRRAEGARVGRRLAQIGLALSVLFGVAGPTKLVADARWHLDEARPVARQWFTYLAHGEVARADQLHLVSRLRPPEDADPLDLYRGDLQARRHLEKFVRQPLVRTLLALGDKATVRVYSAPWAQFVESSWIMKPVYVVTYQEAGRKKSFFVRLTLERGNQTPPGPEAWRIADFLGGFQPKEFAY